MPTNPHDGLEFNEWLAAAFREFRNQCGHPPAEPVMHRWQRSYAQGAHPPQPRSSTSTGGRWPSSATAS